MKNVFIRHLSTPTVFIYLSVPPQNVRGLGGGYRAARGARLAMRRVLRLADSSFLLETGGATPAGRHRVITCRVNVSLGETRFPPNGSCVSPSSARVHERRRTTVIMILLRASWFPWRVGAVLSEEGRSTRTTIIIRQAGVPGRGESVLACIHGPLSSNPFTRAYLTV